MLAATFTLMYKMRKQSLLTLKMMELNKELGFDLPRFLSACWPILKEGGIDGWSWKLQWYGSDLDGMEGDQNAKLLLNHSLSISDVTLHLDLYMNSQNPERKHFGRLLAEQLYLLATTDVWIKTGSTEKAFQQAHRVNVFLQHDMKNLAQLIHLAADRAIKLDQDPERLSKMLALALQAAAERADRILDSVNSREESPDLPTKIDLGELWIQTANIHNLNIRLSGDAQIEISEKSLQSILDNLLINYVEDSRLYHPEKGSLNVDINQRGNKVICQLWHTESPQLEDPERIFEPFWSSKREQLGIGLYQAQQLSFALGGGLKVDSEPDKPLIFQLILPTESQK